MTIQPASGEMMYAQLMPVTSSRRSISTRSPAYSVPTIVASVLGELRMLIWLMTVAVFSLIFTGSVSVGVVCVSVGAEVSERFRLMLGSVVEPVEESFFFMQPANSVEARLSTQMTLNVFLSVRLSEKFMALPHFRLISQRYYSGKGGHLSIV